jgi:hypothetical protein
LHVRRRPITCQNLFDRVIRRPLVIVIAIHLRASMVPARGGAFLYVREAFLLKETPLSSRVDPRLVARCAEGFFLSKREREGERKRGPMRGVDPAASG